MKKFVKFSEGAKKRITKNEPPKPLDPKTAPVRITVIKTGNISVVIGKDKPQGEYCSAIISHSPKRNP